MSGIVRRFGGEQGQVNVAEVSLIQQFVNMLDGMSFVAGALVLAILALLANRAGEWVWKREVIGLRAELEKAEVRADKWERLALQSTGILETTVQETVALRRQSQS